MASYGNFFLIYATVGDTTKTPSSLQHNSINIVTKSSRKINNKNPYNQQMPPSVTNPNLYYVLIFMTKQIYTWISTFKKWLILDSSLHSI